MATKKAVYTVITGYKEVLNNPLKNISKGNDYDAICFTDNPSLKSDFWTIKLLDTQGLNPAHESRLPKLLPHKFLSEFQVSLYIDNTVTFNTDPQEIFDSYEHSISPLVCFPHPQRSCVYEEGEEVIRQGLEDEAKVRGQLEFYAEQGLPKNNGLIAGTVLLRRHHDPLLVKLSEAWLNHVLGFSKRDQISFSFIAWFFNFQPSYFPGSLHDNELITYLVKDGYSPYPRLPGNFDDKFYRWLHLESVTSSLEARKHYLENGIYKSLLYKAYQWDLNRIANHYRTDKGDLYYNRHGYAAVYEHYLRTIKDQEFTLVEIGLLRHDQQAKNISKSYTDIPSLMMWHDYFRNAKIYGFDIADFSKCQPPRRVQIVQGDMGNINDLEVLMHKISSEPVKVIIDDASHASHHQQIALSRLFHSLSPGGFYFIEDLQYQPPSLEIRNCPKTLDILRALKYGYLTRSPFISQENLENLRKHIEFIEFYDSLDRQFGNILPDSLAVIKKKQKIDIDQQSENHPTLGKILLFLDLNLGEDSKTITETISDCLNQVIEASKSCKINFYVQVDEIDKLDEISDLIMEIAFDRIMDEGNDMLNLDIIFISSLSEVFPLGHIPLSSLSKSFTINTKISSNKFKFLFNHIQISEILSIIDL